MGQYWDPNAPMGPPIPRCQWVHSGEAMCPCYMDPRPCIECWGFNVENPPGFNVEEDDDQVDEDHDDRWDGDVDEF